MSVVFLLIYFLLTHLVFWLLHNGKYFRNYWQNWIQILESSYIPRSQIIFFQSTHFFKKRVSNFKKDWEIFFQILFVAFSEYTNFTLSEGIFLLLLIECDFIKVFTQFWWELLSHSCSVFQLSNVIHKTQKPKKLIRPQTSHGGALVHSMYYITQEMNSCVCNFLRMFFEPFLSIFAIFLSVWRRLLLSSNCDLT